VDDVTAERALEVALLGRCELIIEDDDVDVECLRELAQLRDLSLAHVGGGIRPAAALQLARHGFGTGGVGEQRELVEGLLGLLDRVRADPGADEQRALAEDLERALGGGEARSTAAGARLAGARITRHASAPFVSADGSTSTSKTCTTGPQRRSVSQTQTT